ncbi:MAG: GDP-mannose 4,6-dehydratase [Desulfomonile sp.]
MGSEQIRSSSRPAQPTDGRKRALILGVGGQDGYLMSHLLAEKGYEITGVLMPGDMDAPTVPNLPKHVSIVQGSVCDFDLMREVLQEFKPVEIYNFAGISFIPFSWEAPSLVTKVNGFAVAGILESIMKECPSARFFQAGSSEMFGHNPRQSPQNENTPFKPDNPYGCAKVFASSITENFRAHFGLFACVGIFYNHESEWRPEWFVTQKIAKAAAAIRLGLMTSVELGTIDAVRDWSYAGDIVQATWLMMTADHPKNYVLASGRLHSVKDFLEIAFSHVGLKWQNHVKIDPKLTRSEENNPLHGNPSLARKELGWKPVLKFEDLVVKLVDAQLDRLNRTGI